MLCSIYSRLLSYIYYFLRLLCAFEQNSLRSNSVHESQFLFLLICHARTLPSDSPIHYQNCHSYRRVITTSSLPSSVTNNGGCFCIHYHCTTHGAKSPFTPIFTDCGIKPLSKFCCGSCVQYQCSGFNLPTASKSSADNGLSPCSKNDQNFRSPTHSWQHSWRKYPGGGVNPSVTSSTKSLYPVDSAHSSVFF